MKKLDSKIDEEIIYSKRMDKIVNKYVDKILSLKIQVENEYSLIANIKLNLLIRPYLSITSKLFKDI